MKVVCRSFETKARLPVEKYELVGVPELAFATRSVAPRIASLLVASPVVWKTTTFGGRTPTPNLCSARWLVSYAERPGIEKLWNQRFETCWAEKAPKRVSTTQTPMTARRWWAIT